MKLRRSLYAPPVVVGGQQCAKAPPDGGVSPSTAWSRRWPARGRVVACGPVPAADHPRSAYPAELLGGVPGVGVAVVRQAELSAAPSAAGPLSTVGVHPVQILVRSGVQPSGVQPSGCPTVGCPVTWLRRPGPTCPAVWCRPSGGQLSGVRPSVLWRLSRPGSARRGPWEYAGLAGAFAAGVDRVPDGRAAPSTAAGAWTQATQRRSWVDQVGESVGRGPGRVALEPRRPRSTADRPGRLAWPGAARRRRLPLGRDARLPSVVVVELTPEWTGLEGQ
jgi:hypothetical protein